MDHRTYTEGHLTMLGWRPTSEGRGGACKGEWAVYTYKIGLAQEINVDSARRPVHPFKLLDMWMMSDELFWPIVHYIHDHHEP